MEDFTRTGPQPVPSTPAHRGADAAPPGEGGDTGLQAVPQGGQQKEPMEWLADGRVKIGDKTYKLKVTIPGAGGGRPLETSELNAIGGDIINLLNNVGHDLSKYSATKMFTSGDQPRLEAQKKGETEFTKIDLANPETTEKVAEQLATAQKVDSFIQGFISKVMTAPAGLPPAPPPGAADAPADTDDTEGTGGAGTAPLASRVRSLTAGEGPAVTNPAMLAEAADGEVATTPARLRGRAASLPPPTAGGDPIAATAAVVDNLAMELVEVDATEAVAGAPEAEPAPATAEDITAGARNVFAPKLLFKTPDPSGYRDKIETFDLQGYIQHLRQSPDQGVIERTLARLEGHIDYLNQLVAGRRIGNFRVHVGGVEQNPPDDIVAARNQVLYLLGQIFKHTGDDDKAEQIRSGAAQLRIVVGNHAAGLRNFGKPIALDRKTSKLADPSKLKKGDRVPGTDYIFLGASKSDIGGVEPKFKARTVWNRDDALELANPHTYLSREAVKFIQGNPRAFQAYADKVLPDGHRDLSDAVNCNALLQLLGPTLEGFQETMEGDNSPFKKKELAVDVDTLDALRAAMPLVAHLERNAKPQHLVKLDYGGKGGKGKAKHTIPWARAKTQGLGFLGKAVHKKFSGGTTSEVNEDAVMEVLANDLNQAMGIASMQASLVHTQYPDGTAKLLIDAAFVTGPDGEAFSTLEGTVRGKGNVGHLAGNKLRGADGRLYEIDPRQLASVGVKSLLLGDRDKIGSEGANIGYVITTYRGKKMARIVNIDPGKAFEEGEGVETRGKSKTKKTDRMYDDNMTSDGRFRNPEYSTADVKTKGYKNFSIFEDTKLSEKMEGYRDLLASWDMMDAIFDDYLAAFDPKTHPDLVGEHSGLASIHGRILDAKKRLEHRRGHLLDTMKDRIDLPDAELDLMDNLEKLTSPTTNVALRETSDKVKKAQRKVADAERELESRVTARRGDKEIRKAQRYLTKCKAELESARAKSAEDPTIPLQHLRTVMDERKEWKCEMAEGGRATFSYTAPGPEGALTTAKQLKAFCKGRLEHAPTGEKEEYTALMDGITTSDNTLKLEIPEEMATSRALELFSEFNIAMAKNQPLYSRSELQEDVADRLALLTSDVEYSDRSGVSISGEKGSFADWDITSPVGSDQIAAGIDIGKRKAKKLEKKLAALQDDLGATLPTITRNKGRIELSGSNDQFEHLLERLDEEELAVLRGFQKKRTEPWEPLAT